MMRGPGFGVARDLAGLGALVRQDQSRGNYGIPAVGSNAQFMGLVFDRHLGAPLNPIPYRGAAPALIDQVGGQLPIAIVPGVAMAEFHRAGKLRIVANAAEHRSAMMPDVATLAEAGIKAPSDYLLAVYAPAGTRPEALNPISEATRKLLGTPAMAERIAKAGLLPGYAGSEELRRIGRDSAAFWGEQVRQSGYQPQ